MKELRYVVIIEIIRIYCSVIETLTRNKSMTE